MLWWLGHRLVFYPQQQWDADIVRLAAPAEEFSFRSSDGLILSGVWFPARNPLGVMVYCQGNAGNISHRLPVVETWRDRLRYHVLLFDYRGYGKSDGRPSEEGIYLDTLAAFREARRRTTWNPVLAARSLGTVPAIRVAAEDKARGLVLDSPLASASAMARRMFWIPGLHRLAGFDLDNLTAVRAVRCPILILHGSRDEIIPLEQGRAVYEAAVAPRQFVVLEGQRHNDSREQPETIRRLEEFLAVLDG